MDWIALVIDLSSIIDGIEVVIVCDQGGFVTALEHDGKYRAFAKRGSSKNIGDADHWLLHVGIMNRSL
jgi:hypothetical protein